jgi:hypothetical protein
VCICEREKERKGDKEYIKMRATLSVSEKEKNEECIQERRS